MARATQTENGKAFEYACLKALFDKLSPSQPISIITTPQYETAKNFFSLIDSEMRENLYKAALRASEIIIRLEPQLEYPDKNIPLVLSLQADAEGMKGDVRDVLCIRRQNEWEIGLSCKHNHKAVKHSRLSATIDFGKEWFGFRSSSQYFGEIVPLFDELKRMKEESGGTRLWASIEDKAERYYIPILQAFMRELQRLYDTHGSIIPERMVRYLIGANDFYKVITDDTRRMVRVEAVNIGGTLNRPSERHHSAVPVPAMGLPTRFYHMGFKDGSNNTITVVCDRGWEISMRIHNASSKVEPSLKFDVNLVSLPNTIYAESAPYDK